MDKEDNNPVGQDSDMEHDNSVEQDNDMDQNNYIDQDSDLNQDNNEYVQGIIDIYNLSAEYEGSRALKKINLCVEEGDFLALFGPDDLGKSVLLHVLMGYGAATDGEACIFGSPVGKLTYDERSNVRFVPDQVLLETGSVTDYFKLVSGFSPKYNDELQQDLCEVFDIDVDEVVNEMTYQDNKLIQIIAAICAEPRVLILDEPGNSLTEEAYRTMLTHLKTWNDAGITIFMTANEYEEVRGYCNCYAYMKDGRLLAADNVTAPDTRKKIVTVEGGKPGILEKAAIAMVAEKGVRKSYSYEGSMDSLVMLLGRSHFSDWRVEDMTLGEEITEDYSRWE